MQRVKKSDVIILEYIISFSFVFYEVFILLSRVKAVSRKYNCTVKERFTLDSGKGTDF